MVCSDKKMAKRVAFFGAQKMTAEGYTFEPFTCGGNVRKAAGKGYAVLLPTEELRGDCTCAFFKENWEFGTCKHIVWAGWQAEALEAEAERQAYEDRIGDEAEARMNAESPFGCYPHPHVPGLGV